MKGRRFIYYSEPKEGETKGYAVEVGRVILSDKHAQWVDDNDERIGVVVNGIPNTYMNAYPDKPKPEDNGGY